VLFYGTSKKIILYPTHFIRNVDPVSLDVLEEEKFELLALDPRTGTALSSIATDQQQQQQQSRGSRKWAQFAELLWILRPFVYGNTLNQYMLI
jgi:peroxin-16